MVDDPGNCRACNGYLNKFLHHYLLEVIVGSQTNASPGITGLGTINMKLCPDCVRDFLEKYGVEYPDLMDALHTVNEEERNPV